MQEDTSVSLKTKSIEIFVNVSIKRIQFNNKHFLSWSQFTKINTNLKVSRVKLFNKRLMEFFLNGKTTSNFLSIETGTSRSAMNQSLLWSVNDFQQLSLIIHSSGVLSFNDILSHVHYACKIKLGIQASGRNQATLN